MRVYLVELAIPANTPEDSPIVKTLPIEGAVLDTIHFLIPDGHLSLARMSIFYGIKQIFPYESGTWLRGNNESFTLRPKWPMPESRLNLIFKGWNEDEIYDHTFYIRLEVAEQPEEARPWKIIIDFVAILKKLMGL